MKNYVDLFCFTDDYKLILNEDEHQYELLDRAGVIQTFIKQSVIDDPEGRVDKSFYSLRRYVKHLCAIYHLSILSGYKVDKYGDVSLYDSSDVNFANEMRVRAFTTGERGGDAGHGAKHIVDFVDLGGTAMSCELVKGNGFPMGEEVGMECGTIRMIFRGDSEGYCAATALVRAGNMLMDLIHKCNAINGSSENYPENEADADFNEEAEKCLF